MMWSDWNQNAVMLSASMQLPLEGTDEYVKKLPDDSIRKQLELELAYYRGDFSKVLKQQQTIRHEDANWIGFSGFAMVAAVSCGEYEQFRRIWSEVEKQKTKQAETVMALVELSMLLPEQLPKWLQKGDFSKAAPGERLYLTYIHLCYLRITRQRETMLAEARTTLNFIQVPGYFYPVEIYLYLFCAIAAHHENRESEAGEYLDQALELALPRGFITPVVEMAAYLGELLEKHLARDWKQFEKKIYEQWQQTWHHWIDFHNHFAAEHITIILTKKEYLIACYLKRGLSYQEIADRMNYSLGYLKNCISIIYSKLCIHNRKELESFII